jgi:hypothetical protein
MMLNKERRLIELGAELLLVQRPNQISLDAARFPHRLGLHESALSR